MDGCGAALPETVGTATSSERQTPRPGMTLEALLQFAETHVPARRTCVELAQARQRLAPGPEQLEQLESQAWQEDEVVSKYCDLVHVGKQRPLVRTGRAELQVEHWLKDGPEQVAQSGWHLTQEPLELNEFEGQEETH